MILLIKKAFAQQGDNLGSGSSVSLKNPLGENTDLLILLGRLVDVLIKYGVVIAAFFIIYSGFLFVTARGNEGKIETAKNTFLYTVLGSAVLLGAKVIIALVAETVKTL